jgi:CMP/dCMP kinase
MKKQKKIIVAIDGYSSCGKSTLAKDLARKLNYIHIDSGAMYRAVTLYCIEKKIQVSDEEKVVKALPKIKLAFKQHKKTGAVELFMNRKNVSETIRTMKVAELVSIVSKYKKVRQAMVKLQQEFARDKGVVMDGRDIGTVVFPQAALKIFLSADFNVRVDRRYKELRAKNIDITRKEVAENLAMRDHIDVTRTESPLRKADDAREIDNSFLSPADQLTLALHLALQKINS